MKTVDNQLITMVIDNLERLDHNGKVSAMMSLGNDERYLLASLLIKAIKAVETKGDQ